MKTYSNQRATNDVKRSNKQPESKMDDQTIEIKITRKELREAGQNMIFDRHKYSVCDIHKKSSLNKLNINIKNRDLYAARRNFINFKYILFISLISLTLNLFIVSTSLKLHIETDKLRISETRGVVVYASPVPEPKRSVSSGRPPINGSIFGKRSLNGVSSKEKKSVKNLAFNEIQESKKIATKLLNQRYSQQSKADNYMDIITRAIDDFLAANEEREYYIVSFC